MCSKQLAWVLSCLLPLLGGCSQYSKVRESPTFALTSSGEQKQLVRSAKSFRSEPLEQIGLYLDSVNASRSKLASNPSDGIAISDYNFAVARIVEIIQENDLHPWDAPLACPSGSESHWQLAFHRSDPRPELHPSLFDIYPTDRLRFKGTLVGEREIRPGLGAPVVIEGSSLDYTKVDQFAQGKRVFFGMTVFIRFQGNECEMVIKDTLQHETAKLDSNVFELAADYQAPLALALSELQVRKRELEGFLNPHKSEGTGRLARLQPYDPNKIPVLFIHGLSNSTATWVPMIDALRNDDIIRQKYQFWYFSYPTGLPYPVPAATLRRQLDQIRETYPDHKDIVVVGHSMGGMISRLLISDSKMTLWDLAFDNPPDQMGFSDESRRLFSDALIFNARSDISRVIYCSASHRGSEDATNALGRLGAKLIGDPFANETITQEVLTEVREDSPARTRNRLPNSIDVLDPDSPFLKAVDTLSPKPGIPFHSIMGDRGKGGNLNRTKPVSSDGIVPYWSSHIDGAESEIIIPSEHWTILHPQGIEEVNRILYEHLESQ